MASVVCLGGQEEAGYVSDLIYTIDIDMIAFSFRQIGCITGDDLQIFIYSLKLDVWWQNSAASNHQPGVNLHFMSFRDMRG